MNLEEPSCKQIAKGGKEGRVMQGNINRGKRDEDEIHVHLLFYGRTR